MLRVGVDAHDKTKPNKPENQAETLDAPRSSEGPSVASSALTLDDPAREPPTANGDFLEVTSVLPSKLLPTAPPSDLADDPTDGRGVREVRVPSDEVRTVASGAGEEVPNIRVPGYEILDVLGRGGMGIVYKARQLSLNRIVALKMILSGGHASSDALGRFYSEAKAVARLQHPNIVQIYEIGHSGDHPYFSLEYLEGGCLQQQMAQMSEDTRRTAQLMETVARAVHHAHRQRIIHRDLKPGNILLSADGTPKITDFGLAKQVEEDSSQTRTGAILGTPAYMAPEQARGGGREIGPAADIYALGAVLYDLLTGRPPFEGSTVLATLQMVQSAEPVPPRHLRSAIPADLQTICLKCLHKAPARRYLTAQDLADDLRRFLDGQPILARPTPVWERMLKWARRRPAQAALLVSGVAVLFTLLVALVRETKNQRDLTKLAQDKSAREEKHAEEMRFSRDEALRLKEIAEKNQRQAQLQAALASRLTGDSYEERGMHGEARRTYENSIELYEGLLQGPAASPSLSADAAGAYLNLWTALAGSGQSGKAENILDRAIKLLEPLAEQPGSDDKYKGDLALCYNNRGIQFQRRREFTKAKDSYEQALALFRRMRREVRERPSYLLEMARVEKNLGVLHQQNNDPPSAERCYRDALKHLGQLVHDAPEDVVYSNELGQTFFNLGGLLGSRRNTEAEAFYDESVRFFDALTRKSGVVPDYRHLLALALTSRATARQRRGDSAAAREDLLEARRLQKRLHDDFPSREAYAVELARTLNRLAAVQAVSERPDESAQSRQEVLTLYDSLPAQMAELSAIRREQQTACDALIAWHDRQARLLGQRGRVPKVVEHLRQLVALRKRRLQTFRTDPDQIAEAVSLVSGGPILWASGMAAQARWQLQEETRRQELASSRSVLAELLIRAKQPEETAELLRDLAAPADAPTKWAGYARAAALAGRCLTRMASDTAVPEAERRRRRQSFAGPALTLLRRAAEQIDRNLPAFLDNDDFAPLRTLEGFPALIKELERKQRSRP